MTKILTVQRGHVARTRGATGGPGEQAMARRVAAAIEAVVDSRVDGWRVKVIDADEDTSRYAGNAFVSLHGDASANSSVRGASVGYRNAEGRKLADAWKRAYEAAGWPGPWMRDNYTTNLGRYYGTGRAVSAGNPRAIIVELGFRTNAEDRAFMDSAAGVQAAAVSVVAAVTGESVDALLGGEAPRIETEPAPVTQRDRPRSSQVLTLGDQGADVKAWQIDLISLLGSSALPRFGADGDFGEETRQATVRAMHQFRLISASADPARPLVGPATRAAMAKALAAKSATASFTFTHTDTLRRGSTGAATREWQRAVQQLLPGSLPRYGADGGFGDETARDTGRAMVVLGLVSSAPANPIVGSRTRKAMASRLSRR